MWPQCSIAVTHMCFSNQSLGAASPSEHRTSMGSDCRLFLFSCSAIGDRAFCFPNYVMVCDVSEASVGTCCNFLSFHKYCLLLFVIYLYKEFTQIVFFFFSFCHVEIPVLFFSTFPAGLNLTFSLLFSFYPNSRCRLWSNNL